MSFERGGLKKFLLGLAVACYMAAAAAIAAVVWVVRTLGSDHIAAPSLFATTVFLAGCGVVLQVMSAPRKRIHESESDPAADRREN